MNAQSMTVRILMTRHSAFYSPIVAAVAAGFLEREGLDATFGLLAPGDLASRALGEGRADVAQSAPSAWWGEAERGGTALPRHFALVNCLDGFFLAGRHPDPEFHWKKLEGRLLVADHLSQPLVMLKHACRCHGVDWSRIRLIDAGTPEEMAAAFRAGQGDYVHLQAPGPQLLEQDGAGWTVASVGAGLKPLAFSTLCASEEFISSAAFEPFVRAFAKAKEWVRTAPPAEVAASEAPLFPGMEAPPLAQAIGRYQALGCWQGGPAITEELHDEALDIFMWAGVVRRHHPWREVCVEL
jgi:NitT/TauT family transport system substrate-binding protein